MNSDDAAAMHDDIRAKLLLSDDDLLAEIGQSLGKGATFTDTIKRGRQVLENLKRELRGKVCSNAKVIACYKGAKEDSVQAVAAIIDAIAGSVAWHPARDHRDIALPDGPDEILRYGLAARGRCEKIAASRRENRMSEADIDAILREFDPIHRQIAQPEGKDAIVVSGVPASAESLRDPAPDPAANAFFCVAAERMLAAGHGFPDSPKYAWMTDPQRYRNSFEASCQGSVVNFLIGLWEHRKYRCDKIVVARNEHTGGFHLETYETVNAYFACISYQFSNLINRYSLLNHYLIAAGQKAESLPCLTPTNEVGGQAIERAIRSRWNDICPHLDAFLTTVAKASAYEASEVLLDKHVAAAAEQFYTSANYVHLRDATRLMAGPFYLPAEVMWTMYADQVLNFTLAHELMHMQNGDIRKPGRDTVEEMGADMGATDLLGYMTVSTAKRGGYRPSIANIIMGPIVFFALSRVFAYFDNFEE
jgi:hypothetical protein